MTGDRDTCRVVDVDGATVVVRGSGTMTPDIVAALEDLVRATRRAAEDNPPHPRVMLSGQERRTLWRIGDAPAAFPRAQQCHSEHPDRPCYPVDGVLAAQWDALDLRFRP